MHTLVFPIRAPHLYRKRLSPGLPGCVSHDRSYVRHVRYSWLSSPMHKTPVSVEVYFDPEDLRRVLVSSMVWKDCKYCKNCLTYQSACATDARYGR